MTARPILIACRGGSPLSQTAGRVVEELERRGLVRAGDGSALPTGDEIVTLDGCPSACLSRRLAAEGRPPGTRLNLADCGVGDETPAALDLGRLADDMARLLRGRATPAALVRPRKPRQRAAASTRRMHTIDDYLLAIDALTNPVAACGALIADVPTLAAHVSGLLGVSRPSAGEMLARLEESGLVRRGEHKELLLTRAGRVAADRAIRRHRLLEVFAASFLDYPLAECYERARTLDSAFDDDSLGHLRAALGDPARCPHGWPVDPAAARAEGAELVSLTALAPGETATVARVTENDASLQQLVELGVVPGARVRAGAGGLDVAGRTVRVDGEPAAAVLVHLTRD
ncbi:MAG TPA: iron dependent repressor, metal binding and dimerization domain protein [Gaiellaceae bacterium]|nr:iron dependent repressor, metal binding and dimerization domain protein [Gaiellaceae bacterium]